MNVSIVIPVREINDYIRESIPHILGLDYGDFEVLILPDGATQESFPKTLVIPTGRIGPAAKRDLAIKYAKGEILAFLDDDAYPRKDWLEKALRHFSDPSVAAVGGPAVTPESDSFFQKVSGAVFLSPLGGGNPERYWPVGGVRQVDDWPSVNLLVRKSVFTEIGGFDSEYWPGEDTKLCLDIISLGKKIVYDPQVLVWHHRRAGLGRHLKQVGGYGLHRGYFAKRYPQNSRRLKYFIPSFFTVFLLAGPLAALWGGAFYGAFYLLGIGAYGLALVSAVFQINRREKNAAVSFVSAFYIFLTHVWYGLRFMQGFFLTAQLRSKLRP